MSRIVILSGIHLCNNPRVYKEAQTLGEAGHDVEVLGGLLNPHFRDRDSDLAKGASFRFSYAYRLADQSGGRPLRAQLMRAQRWAGVRMLAWLGIETAAALGYGLKRSLAEARTRAADLYIAHAEPMLWVARELAGDGCRIGVDIEDWFSELWTAGAAAQRPRRLLRRLEREVLAEAVHSTCTSRAMAAGIASAYGCRTPKVVYNAFPWRDRLAMDGAAQDRAQSAVPSIHWFSQVIGPGRGLEDLFSALSAVTAPAELHLRGGATDEARHWVDTLVPAPWKERVFLHPVVHNRELLSRIAEHDIGIAAETTETRNRDMTVSNKILQYMQGGLAVVASATTGQREVAQAAPLAVSLYPPGDAAELASRLNELLCDSTKLAQAKIAALNAAHDVFSWEMMAPILVESVERALRPPERRGESHLVASGAE